MLIWLFFPQSVTSHCEEGSIDTFVGYIYQKAGCGLTEVPSDIPAEATLVRLDNNEISFIPPTAFSHLIECTVLWLFGNELTHISADVFANLSQLIVLNLENNGISNIEPEAFSQLTRMRVLNLVGNKITTLEMNVFGNHHPAYLTLLLSRNPLKCDSKVCWMKQFERERRITLNYTRAYGHFWPKPECTNYPDHNWDNITFGCPFEGICFLILVSGKTASKIQR